MKLIQKIFLSIFLLNLTACGFTPMYSAGIGDERLASIKVAVVNVTTNIPSQVERHLKENLKMRFNPLDISAPQRYELVIKLSTSLTSFQTQNNTVTTRRSVKLVANYELLDILTKKVLLKDVVTSVDSFQIADSPYSALITEEGTAYNMTREMANEISNRIASFEVYS